MKSREYPDSSSLWIHAAYAILFTIVIFWFAPHLFGQSRAAGEIRGTVTDSTGAVVPDAKVAIKNVLTGTSYDFVTDKDGVYDDNFVRNGTYTVTVTKEGFKQFVKSDITVTQDLIGVNAVLQPGSVHETIEVQAETNEVETESTEVHTTFTAEDLADLPNIGRVSISMTSFMPGATGSGEQTSFNGTAALQSNWQIDGGNAFFAFSQNTNGVYPPIDAIAEFKVTTSNFGAEFGNGLSVVNEVTKSGTNHWHGSLFEWNQNNMDAAADYFSRFKPNQVWNQFGGTLGGPIKRNKAFFFFTYQGTRIGSQWVGFQELPTPAMQSGDFGEMCYLEQGTFASTGPNAGLCVDQSGNFLEQGQLYDPATYNPAANTRQPFALNQIPQSRFDQVAKNIQQYFPPANNVNATGGLPSGYDDFFSVPTPYSSHYYEAKLDYDVTSNNRLTYSFLNTDIHAWDIASPLCPLDCYTMHQPVNGSTQLTDNWTITPHLANQARFTVSAYASGWINETTGKGYPAKLGLIDASADTFPDIIIGGLWGGFNAGNGAGMNEAFQREVDLVPSDLATWVHGKHIVEFGGEFDRWYNGEQWPDQLEGTFVFSGTYTNNPIDAGITSFGDGYADFLLGFPGYWSTGVPPRTTGKDTGLHLFVSDAYKIRPNLTVTLGLRGLYQTGWSEAHNMVYNFSPTLYNPGINPFTGLPVDGPGAMLWGGAGPDGMTRLENPLHFFMPRIGFAWEPIKHTSIRGGYGLYNYMQGGYAYGYFPATYYGTFGQELPNGVTPLFSLAGGDEGPSGSVVPQGPTASIAPLPASGRTADALNGDGVMYFSPKMHIGYTEQFQLDVEHRFAGDILATVAYVGNRGHHLPYNSYNTRDMNQVGSYNPVQDQQDLNAAAADFYNSGYNQAAIQPYRPFPQYLQINLSDNSDWSHYDSLQATVKKRLSHGVSVQANYTWSHARDSGSAQAGGQYFSGAVFQNYYDKRADYGNSQQDVRQVFHGWVTYDLPVGKGKAFLNRPGLVDAIVGSWSATFVANANTGWMYTPQWGAFYQNPAGSGTLRPNRTGSGTLPKSKRSINEWFDINAFTNPETSNTTFEWGNSGRDILSGPGYQDYDMSLRKNFAIPWLGEEGRLQLQAQATNIFNHVNLGNPNSSVGVPVVPASGTTFASGPGTINSDAGPRIMQIGATLRF